MWTVDHKCIHKKFEERESVFRFGRTSSSLFKKIPPPPSLSVTLIFSPYTRKYGKHLSFFQKIHDSLTWFKKIQTHDTNPTQFKMAKTQSKSAKSTKKGGDKKRRKRRVESYASYIYKVLKQVHPIPISRRAMSIMNSFVGTRSIVFREAVVFLDTTRRRPWRPEKSRLLFVCLFPVSFPSTPFPREPRRDQALHIVQEQLSLFGVCVSFLLVRSNVWKALFFL